MSTLIVCWLLLPVLLAAVTAGWGWLVQRAAGTSLHGALLLPLGFAAVTLVGAATTATDATAELIFPLVVAGGALGLVWLWRAGEILVEPWIALAAVAVFLIYGVPVLFSGEATFAGYSRLDDTATWFALTDHLLEKGRSLEGLAPSTYEETLVFNLGAWYPVGAFPPLGVAARLVGLDLAWVVQPYLAFLGALLALALAAIAAPFAGSARRTALVAVVAAQPALLIGYALWGGLKEMATAPLIALVAALAAAAVKERAGPRQLIPLAVACAALIAVLTAAGTVWIAPVLLVAAVVAVSEHGSPAWVLRTAAIAAGLIALIGIPLAIAGGVAPPSPDSVGDLADIGNLSGPLNFLQVMGIWPAGDFRLTPELPLLTYIAITIAIATAAYALWWSWGRGAWAVLLYGAAAIVGTAVIVVFGSAWVDAKALAIASPALLFLAMIGAMALINADRAFEGWGAVAVIAAGVAISNLFAYHDVNLAPRDQLRELESIGERIEGQGPTLITEFQPYGTRHFLREADPEAPSELRFRAIALDNGELLQPGLFADTDELRFGGLDPFRTLVVRRSPTQSRPSADYELLSSGGYYELWQRPAGEPTIDAHLPLGQITPGEPGASLARVGVPDCAEVLGLARRAGPDGELVAAGGRQPVAVSLRKTEHPRSWDGEAPESLYPDSDGTASGKFSLPREGDYGLWLVGSVRGKLEALIDGGPVGEKSHFLNNIGQFIELGAAQLAPGPHTFELRYSKPLLEPGSGGEPLAIGPLMLGTSSADAPPPTRVAAAGARSLCGKPWDWIEAQSPAAGG